MPVGFHHVRFLSFPKKREGLCRERAFTRNTYSPASLFLCPLPSRACWLRTKMHGGHSKKSTARHHGCVPRGVETTGVDRTVKMTNEAPTSSNPTVLHPPRRNHSEDLVSFSSCTRQNKQPREGDKPDKTRRDERARCYRLDDDEAEAEAEAAAAAAAAAVKTSSNDGEQEEEDNDEPDDPDVDEEEGVGQADKVAESCMKSRSRRCCSGDRSFLRAVLSVRRTYSCGVRTISAICLRDFRLPSCSPYLFFF